MERKLKLEDIAGYLPYGLFTYVGTLNTEYSLLETVSKNFIVFHYKSNSGFENTATIENIKPILRPLSDLYRPITHNEKEIVPIVELANMVRITNDKFYLEENTNRCWSEDRTFEFGFFSGMFWLVDADRTEIKHLSQYQLFDYLHELKIDYRGLIESGLAIDCNTLDINPYK